VSDSEIRIVVPDDTYPVDADHPFTRPIPVADRLRPGPISVEVQTLWPTEVVEGGLDRGVVTTEDRRQNSNQGVFLLAPEVSNTNPTTEALGNLGAAVLTVNGRRLFQAGAKSVVLIGDMSIPVSDPGPGGPQSDTSIQVSLNALTLTTPPIPPGNYPVRMMVNGVQSMENVIFGVT
jgi:hypothetical protein